MAKKAVAKSGKRGRAAGTSARTRAAASRTKRAAKKSTSGARASAGSLSRYKAKRNFARTAEPEGQVHRDAERRAFVVQKHDASRLHYDLRLELDGVLKSWAVPKGPSLDPADKRLAVHVEDHPLEYGSFEGTIPQGEYGGGTVMLWDRGQWTPLEDPHEGYKTGKLKFRLNGEKLRGGWMLVRKGGRNAAPDEKTWFLIKERDDEARPGDEVRIDEALPLSVKTGRDLDEIAHGAKAKKKSKAKNRSRASDTSRADANGSKSSPTATLTAKTATLGRKAPLPRWIQPQLATLAKEAPDGDRWVHEIKFDGYRMICRLDRGRATFLSRNEQDWTARLAELSGAVGSLHAKQALLDGEVVVIQPDGTTSFQALQNAFADRRTAKLVYYVFDLLHLDGRDLTAVPLVERKAILSELVRETSRGPLRFVEHLEGNGPRFFKQACRVGLEGIISKMRDRPYRPGRSDEWLKTKCGFSDEFVICGYTDPSGARTGLGALLLCYHNRRGELVYAGRVGTGFSEKTLADLHARLKQLECKESPLDKKPAGSLGKGIHWVKPDLVAQVQFSNWTNEGILRHPSFQGLREDKPAAQVVRETPRNPDAIEALVPRTAARASSKAKSGSRKGKHRGTSKLTDEGAKATSKHASNGKANPSSAPQDSVVAGVRISHPDRVLYPEQGLTKLAVASYYEAIGDWMLPHVKGRPLSLVRCPAGPQKQCFFQKHAFAGLPDFIGRVEIRERDKTGTHLVVENVRGLVALVQFGVLEFHIWGSRADDVEKPDRLVFDLDPGPDVDWKEVIAAARLMRSTLEDLGFESFLKTTGGKGLHVVAPIRRHETWDEVKLFCRAVAQRLVSDSPERYTLNMAKSARSGKIFIDYLRNDRGATFVAPYSSRAREGAPVSTPLAWEELRPNLHADHFTVNNLPARLSALKADPWAEIAHVRQGITARTKKLLGLSG